MDLHPLLEGCQQSLTAIRTRRPRVHCITNAVAMSYSANMLLAVGAQPAMSLAPDELADFVASAAALSVNLGTLDDARRQAIAIALDTARRHGTPWVLDPVLVHAAPSRLAYARELGALRPTVIRGNAQEIVALAGSQTDAAQILAQRCGCVVAQTGRVDVISDGRQQLTLGNGHALMDSVTATGCALSALVGAFLAVEPDPLAAAAQAVLALTVAAEIAAETATGPGSFQPAVLDALYQLTPQQLNQRSTIQ